MSREEIAQKWVEQYTPGDNYPGYDGFLAGYEYLNTQFRNLGKEWRELEEEELSTHHKLEDGIEIPPVVKRNQYRGGQGETEFTSLLREMKVGQSFKTERPKTSISQAISRIRKETGEKRFTTREVSTKLTGMNVYRIWRTQ